MTVVLLLSSLLVISCIGIHYQSLVFLSKRHRLQRESRKWWINLLILGAMGAHIFEMSLFGLLYAWLCDDQKYGFIQESSGAVSTDYWYFSFVVYTSLGFGDLTPVGSIRMMTALETLTGLVLIGWTASFLFVEMQSWAESRTSTSHEQEID